MFSKLSKSLLFLPLIFALLLTSCSDKVYTINSSNKSGVLVKSAFTQREVPGQSSSKPKTFLNLIFDVKEAGDKVVKFKKIHFQNKIYDLGNKQLLRFKMDLRAGVDNKAQPNNEPSTALVYCTIDGVEKVLQIKDVEKKETLYLP